MSKALNIDFYQLTTLIGLYDRFRGLDEKVTMAFFFRKMPKNRNYVVACGIEEIQKNLDRFFLNAEDIKYLLQSPLKSKLLERPDLLDWLLELEHFEGNIRSVQDGEFLFAGPAHTVSLDQAHLTFPGYMPFMFVETDILTAKLIETPWLSTLNHMSMVASKATRVVYAAGGKPVYEFGQRRTDADASVRASYAAIMAGCAGTSNVRAAQHYNLPCVGTMDHFYIQAFENSSMSREESEREAFKQFALLYPENCICLVDTYDTFKGIRNAVEATNKKLKGIRIDSNVNYQTVTYARKILHELNVPHVKIIISDGLDEHKVKELAPHVDGFGVGENITCSPDSPTGVGCVGKLCVLSGRDTMKISSHSGKMTLPGTFKVIRKENADTIQTTTESHGTGYNLYNPERCYVKPIDRVKENMEFFHDFMDLENNVQRNIFISNAYYKQFKNAFERN